MNNQVVVAIDAGTTGVRAFAVDGDGRPQAWSYREFPQYFPQPGWVEHDPDEIYAATEAVLGDVARATRGRRATRSSRSGSPTSVRRPSCGVAAPARPRHRAIVWQDRRTAATMRRAEGGRATNRSSGAAPASCSTPTSRPPSWHWLLTEGGVARDDDLCFGTIDSWLLWKLTGGPGPDAVHATDPSNASRTLLFDIDTARLVRRAVRAVRRAPVDPPDGATEQRPLRDDRSSRRQPGCGSR